MVYGVSEVGLGDRWGDEEVALEKSEIKHHEEIVKY